MNEDYPLFVKWFEATDWILDTVEKFPKSVRFTISGRIANMAIDVMEGIIEAIYTRDRAYILGRINLYIEKLRVMFRLSYKRRYISKQQYEYVSEVLNETGKMIGGLEEKRMRRTGYLFDTICSFENLYQAFKKAFQGSGGHRRRADSIFIWRRNCSNSNRP